MQSIRQIKIQILSNFVILGFAGGECKPFIVEGFQVGLIKKDVLKHLLRYPEVSNLKYAFKI